MAHTGRITVSAKQAGVTWRTHYNWMKDPEYAVAFEEARKMAGDFLEEEAIRRAREGVMRPVHYKGAHVDDVPEFSDTLLIFLLKGAKPERYKERTEHSGEVGHQVTIIEHRYGNSSK
jgi:hypothetical protein